MSENLHFSWLQIQGQTAEHIVSPLEVAQEADSYEDAANNHHAYVQHTQWLLELLRLLHLVFQREYLLAK